MMLVIEARCRAPNDLAGRCKFHFQELLGSVGRHSLARIDLEAQSRSPLLNIRLLQDPAISELSF